MTINFNTGLKRIYLIFSFVWIAVFIYLSFQNFDVQYKTIKPIKYAAKDLKCQDYFGAGKLKPVSNIFYKVDGVFLSVNKNDPSKSYKINYVYNTYGGDCAIGYKLSFFDRIEYSNRIYLYLVLVPLPLYFLILFIIDGFKQPASKVNKKRKAK